MKNIFTALILLFTGTLFGQTEAKLLKGVKIFDREKYKKEDTIPKVFYLKDDQLNKKPFIYINGEKYDEHFFSIIDTDVIEKLEVEKEDQYADNENYTGSIFITLKNAYKPKLVSLNQLKSKYIKEINSPTLFLLNDKPVKGDYDKFLVDEKFIMKIEVEEIINEKEALNINIIKLITRTEKNLEKANIIYIRGDKSNE